MKVPMNWLKEYVEINCGTDEYVRRITMSGSKVEGIDEPGAEIVNVMVGRVLEINRHPDADKLVVAQTDIGDAIVQIVTGAVNVSAGDYIPAAVAPAFLPGGKKIVKGKLRGVESNGMMCSIQELQLTKAEYPEADEDGIFILNKSFNPDVLKPGTDIRELLGLGGTVVEFEITPNRPDCLSIYGMARETAATLDTELKKIDLAPVETDEKASDYASVTIENTKLCPRYAARIIRNVKIGPSPRWMSERLKSAGIRAINNIVDITNYVMLEMGQPMHAFDLNNLSGRRIIVRNARPGEQIQTLDGQFRDLEPWMLVIADAEKCVAVAGVMGGANSEITDTTTEMLLESATFAKTVVRLGSKKLGMRTEASSRFEKGLDVENAVAAVNRAARLIEMTGAGTVCKGIIDAYEPEPAAPGIKLRPEKINAFLGTDISTEKMVGILKKIDFIVTPELIVYAPHFRLDIETEADLAEEIARFHGYNNITPTLLDGTATTQGGLSASQKNEELIRETMIACGLSEVYTYTFTSDKVFDKLNMPENDGLRNTVVLANPLGEDFGIMRTTTVPSMLDVIAVNSSRRIGAGGFFEISNVYTPNPDSAANEGLPYQKAVLTIGLYGGDADFFKLKGIIEALLDAMKVNKYDFEPLTGCPYYHPGRAATVKCGRNAAGTAGEIHPSVAENFSADARSYVAVLDIGAVTAKSAGKIPQYKPLPRFPSVDRDIALLVRDDVTVKSIESAIQKKGAGIIEEIRMFDFYKGPQVPEGLKSVAYALTFRADERTLTDEEVNAVMAEIVKELEGTLGARLR